MKLLITDIDGTLANDDWRNNIGDYDERIKAATRDEPMPCMVELVNTLSGNDWCVLCLTSRNERWRSLTHKWLLQHDINCYDLHMRANENYEKAPEYKVTAVRNILLGLLATKVNVEKNALILIDSREDVVTAYKAEGWSALTS